MLALLGSIGSFCDRVHRRDFLRLGIGSVGLGLAGLFRARALSGERSRPAKSVILICLQGGPSHIDLYDLKPEAPVEFRGELQPIDTNVPGVRISELLPLQAQIADKFAIIRSMTFATRPPRDHDLQEVFTGFPEEYQRPAFGSIVSWQLASHGQALPRYVSLGTINPNLLQRRHPEDSLYLGARYGFFEHRGGVENLALLSAISRQRHGDRLALLQQLDGMRRDLDRRGESVAMDAYTQQAVDMITSPAVANAFDLSKEPERVRAAYGPDLPPPNVGIGAFGAWLPGKFLLARRLVEAGVPVVTVTAGSWDHHGILSNGPNGGIYERLRNEAPRLDRGLYALLNDLDQRGMLNDVAVVVTGEMGRTPRINRQEGRDHWPDSGFALIAGGGMRMGQAIGATDSRAQRPITRPINMQNVLATMYRHLGIDPSLTIADFTGRPRFLLDDQQPIGELL